MKLTSHASLQKELRRRPAFREAYEELEVEFTLVDALIRARLEQGITQAQLAKRIGTQQSAIARFESGVGNPTLAFIQRLADALGLKLKITVH